MVKLYIIHLYEDEDEEHKLMDPKRTRSKQKRHFKRQVQELSLQPGFCIFFSK